MLSQDQVEKINKAVKGPDTKLLRVFDALSDSGRYIIFKTLIKYEGICVTEVSRILKVSVPAASQQLKIMETAGLVKRYREGQRICYEIDTKDPFIKSIIKLVLK